MNNTALIRVNLSTIESGNAEMLLNEAISYLTRSKRVNQLKLKNKFAAYLSNKNLSKTAERFKILEKICLEEHPFTTKIIHKRVSEDIHVSIRTINRGFELLLDAKIIKRVNENDKNELFKTTYFELIP